MSQQNDILAAFDIEAREAEAAQALEADPPVVTEEEPAEPAEEPAEAPAEPTEGDAPDEAPAAAEAPTEAEQLYMGKYKSPEDMESAFREYQSHSDRQLAEEKARREAYEQMISAEQQMIQQQQAMESQQPIDVSEEDLASGIDQAPIDTFQWAVQNNPTLIPKIIAGVSEKHGQQTGMELQSVWTNIQLQAQNEQMQQQMQAQFRQVMEPQMVQQSINDGLSAVEQKYGEDFNALRTETAETLKEMGQLPSYDPQTIAQAVEYSFLQAHRSRALQAASTNSEVRTPTPQESVETGTPGAAPVTTEVDDIKQGILDAYQKDPFR